MATTSASDIAVHDQSKKIMASFSEVGLHDEIETEYKAENPPPVATKSRWTSMSDTLVTRWDRSMNAVGQAQDTMGSQFLKLRPIAWFEAKYPGWQAGVIAGIIASIFVLIFNIAFLIAASRHHWGTDGLGTLMEGDCDKIATLNKVAHGFINIMSTFLLIQSNYCMQLLASPTRFDVDFAHRRRQWVDIGVQSFRNVWKRHISLWRCIYWTLLAISSVPLHLLWNSVIIFSPSAYQYTELVVTEGFVHGLEPGFNGYVGLANSEDIIQDQYPMYPDSPYIVQNETFNRAIWKNISNVECKQAYAQSFVRDRSDVIVVTIPPTPETGNSQILYASAGGSGAWPYQWLCPTDSAENFKCYDEIRRPEESWKLSITNTPEVLYCLSKQMNAQCKLQYGFWITFFTIVANGFKVICFIITYRVMKHHTKKEEGPGAKSNAGEKLLITTGDAIASFLEYPDPETIGMSIVEKEDFRYGIWYLRWIPISPMVWRRRFECSWFRAIGSQRWFFGILPLAALSVLPTLFLMSKAEWLTNEIGLTTSAIKQLGIGNPSGLFLFGSRSKTGQLLGWRLLAKVALANLPQLAVSVAYYMWNNHLAAMIAAREYDAYAAPVLYSNGAIGPGGKHGLRVTDPLKESDQKSTRFLTVPLRYGLTNIVLWTLLHYLASQAIFFARVDILDHWLEVTDYSISQVGYSVLGLIYFLLSAYAVFLYAVWMSLRRLPNRMPLAATCSGALSAACHPRTPGLMHHEKRVHWGVEVVDDDHPHGPKDGFKGLRCTFTSEEAYYPEVGRYYA